MSQKNQKPSTKTMHTLNSPHSDIAWPTVIHHDQLSILDQLCSLLTPIGEHRSKFVVPSKGKRGKRSKGESNRQNLSSEGVIVPTDKQDQTAPVPPSPDIASFLTIGFNSTERCLEAAAQRCVPASISKVVGTQESHDEQIPLAAVFIDRSDYPPMVHSHLPLLVAIASLNAPLEPQIRLIALPKGAGARLATTLRIQRTAIIGLGRDAPGARSLVNFIRDHIAPIEVPWLLHVREVNYLPISITTSIVVGTGPAGKPQLIEQPPSKKQRKQGRASLVKEI